jgi:CheY-like chemotaxis protein
VELQVANAELARAARLKDEFLASMSHELRTPLNAILGMSETLYEEIYGPLNEKQLKSVRTIEESGRHLLSLINDILDLSKIGAGKLALEDAPVSVQSVCYASLQFVKQMAHSKQIKLSSNHDDVAITLLADELRLKQILVNLLSNAVKFTPNGGEVGLEVKGDAEKSVVRFIVWDTGIGIAEEDMVRLFQPFVQLDSRLSREYSGTGLGLSLVYRLTEMHGGSVSVESQAGQGSRFIISLPWRKPENLSRTHLFDGEKPEITLQTSEPEFEISNRKPSMVLLAEDNQANIDTMSNYLSSKGYQIILARNGAEAIARAEADHPDIILMDIQLPQVDGLEATRRLRANPDLAAIPIIALTALAMPGDRERCLAAGANDYLSKPIGLKLLAETIETQLKG